MCSGLRAILSGPLSSRCHPSAHPQSRRRPVAEVLLGDHCRVRSSRNDPGCLEGQRLEPGGTSEDGKFVERLFWSEARRGKLIPCLGLAGWISSGPPPRLEKAYDV